MVSIRVSLKFNLKLRVSLNLKLHVSLKFKGSLKKVKLIANR